MNLNETSPGPWKAHGSEQTHSVMVKDVNGKTIARVVNNETDWYNALLMAESHELLENLRAAFSHMRSGNEALSIKIEAQLKRLSKK